jgi:hypothetical protein
MTLHAPKLIGFVGQNRGQIHANLQNDQTQIEEWFENSMEQIWIDTRYRTIEEVSELILHWKTLWIKKNNGKWDNFSCILEIDLASEKRQSWIQLMVEFNLETFAIKNFQDVGHLKEFFMELEDASKKIIHSFIFYLIVQNDEILSCFESFYSTLHDMECVNILCIDRQAIIQTRNIQNLAFIEQKLISNSSQHDWPTCVYDFHMEKEEITEIERDALWTLLQIGYNWIVVSTRSYIKEVLNSIERIIAQYITEQKANYSKE